MFARSIRRYLPCRMLSYWSDKSDKGPEQQQVRKKKEVNQWGKEKGDSRLFCVPCRRRRQCMVSMFFLLN